ncbi:MAG: outer membrane beta-barrel protein [Rhodospirillales bacterium]|nr:outer membrane beta-barrel protein [Rhodospirillales bacterium]
MIKRLKWSAALCLTCAVVGAGVPVSARAAESVDPFAFRTRSDRAEAIKVDPFLYRGEPRVVSSFILWPNLTLRQSYKDNIYATQDDPESDFVTSIAPSLVVRKDVGRHEFILSLDAEMSRYWKNSDENTLDYSAAFEADLEARRGINIPVKVFYKDGHVARDGQRRASASDLTVEPLRMKNFGGEAGIVVKPNRMTVSLTGGFHGTRLENGVIAGTGAPSIRDTKDVDVYQAGVKAEYKAFNGLTPYLSVRASQENFIRQAPTDIARDNRRLRVLAGSAFNYRGLIYGSLGAGWEKRTYDAASLKPLKGLSLEGQVFWEPTAKIRLGVEASRNTVEDNLIAAGLTSTQAGVDLSYEMRRNFFLKLKTGYTYEKYDTSARTDKTLSFGPELLYMVSPHLQLGAEYQYVTRDSTASGLDLDSSVFLLRLTRSF